MYINRLFLYLQLSLKKLGLINGLQYLGSNYRLYFYN